MPSLKITKSIIDAMLPGNRPQFLWDDEVKGFGVKITPAGKRVYVFQYRPGGRGVSTKRMTIGQHGSMTPDQARRLARQLRVEVDTGSDPIEATREQREAREEAMRLKAEAERDAATLRIDALADQFLKDHVLLNRPATYSFYEGYLRRHIKTSLGAVTLPELTGKLVKDMLRKIPSDRVAMRRNAFATLSAMASWAVDEYDLPFNPMSALKSPPAPKARDRVLSDDELRIIWDATSDLHVVHRHFYQMAILTGQRRDEVAGMVWDELDRKAAEWTLPGERTKNNEANIVPLSPSAIALLDKIAASDKWPSRGPVFTTDGKRSIAGFSAAKAALGVAVDKRLTALGDEAPTFAKWRVHDIRRTVATGLQRLGVRFEVTEAVLNHTSGAKGGIAGVYQRYGWGPEKRAALDAWAHKIETILNPADTRANVIELSARAEQ